MCKNPECFKNISVIHGEAHLDIADDIANISVDRYFNLGVPDKSSNECTVSVSCVPFVTLFCCHEKKDAWIQFKCHRLDILYGIYCNTRGNVTAPFLDLSLKTNSQYYNY